MIQSSNEEAEEICAKVVACLCIVLMVAQKQNDLKAGTYVSMHGLNNALYNDLEGLVVKKRNEKGTRKIINVLCKNITIMPIYKTSRCKLMRHKK